MGRSLRVVVAHDYVTQRGGAERTVLGLLQAFPGARLVTSVFRPETTFPEFADVDVTTTPLDRVPAFRRDTRLAFPFLARAWERLIVDDADVVICSSSGWSHAVSTTAPKIVYCHNPARWLYQAEDYLAGASTQVRAMRNLLAPRLIEWDRRHAATASAYVVNSNVVAGRVLMQYGREALVIPPPVTLDPHGSQEPVHGLEPGFLLTVSRARSYKNVQLVCEAAQSLPAERLVVIGGLPDCGSRGAWSDRLTGVEDVGDAQLRWLYANCRAVVSASREDFGLTPLEGNLFGKPAMLLRAGGFLDTLVDGMTGGFIEEETVPAVRDALLRIPAVDPSLLRTYAEGFRTHVFARRMREVVDSVLSGVTLLKTGLFQPTSSRLGDAQQGVGVH
jgi:glycosyltransferase involved in cell wall biosynthesis